MTESFTADEEFAQIMGEDPAPLMDAVYDPQHQRYFAPALHFDLNQPVDFDAAKVVMAILDTGVLSQHPVFKATLVEQVDFTGEGVEDRHGHGSVVGLLSMQGQQFASPIVSVKILNAQGQGDRRWLIAGLDWLVEWSRKQAQGKKVIANLSAGIYHRRFGILPCQGNCDICAAAKRAADAGIFLCMAAGNDGPEQSPCPQKAALLERFPAAVVAATDPEGLHLRDYSGPGNFAVTDAVEPWQPLPDRH